MVNLESTPTSDSSIILPPMTSQMRLQIESPSPVRPYWRVVEDSAWVKEAKIPFRSDGEL